MASEVEICNAALQKLGAKFITSMSDDNKNARQCAGCYERLRDAELRKHPWNFSITRESLAADSPAPTWGRANSFTLPADYLKLVNPYPEDNSNSRDWVVERGKILTDESAPLYVRYVAKITDPNLMDPLFRDALAARMAHEMCEAITQSNSKKADAANSYSAAIREAKRSNAIENVPIQGTEDEWLTCRA